MVNTCSKYAENIKKCYKCVGRQIQRFLCNIWNALTLENWMNAEYFSTYEIPEKSQLNWKEKHLKILLHINISAVQRDDCTFSLLHFLSIYKSNTTLSTLKFYSSASQHFNLTTLKSDYFLFCYENNHQVLSEEIAKH